MKTLIKYLATALAGVAIAVLILFARGTFSQTVISTIMVDLCDAFCVPGVIILSMGLLFWVGNGGVFDMLKFSVIKLFDLFRRDLSKSKYHTFYDYREAQQDKQRSFGFLLIVGGALTFIGLVFLVVYLAM